MRALVTFECASNPEGSDARP